VYDEEGVLVAQHHLRSGLRAVGDLPGVSSPEEVAWMSQHLGDPYASAITDTEARMVRFVETKPGYTIVAQGRYTPCWLCQGFMEGAAEANGINIIYQKFTNGKLTATFTYTKGF
jgi:hypothetical protein